MKDLFAFDDFIYKINGKKLIKKEDGTITIKVENKERRFIYDKLFGFISKVQNRDDLLLVIDKINTLNKKVRKRNYTYVKIGYSAHKSKSIICTHQDGTEEAFESIYEAHRKLGIRRMTIHSLLKGNVHKKEIYKFHYKQ